MDILARAKELKDEIIANRRYLHQHPEIAHDLPVTVAFVKEKLTEMGYEPKDCGHGGVTATVGGKNGGKTVLLRADMDALPMKEESGLPFASTCDTAAHTCGHDTHTAMLLGAAKILKEMEDTLPGTVKLMFQPAEETVTGAQDMIDDGILEDPHVDAALAIHIWAMEPSGRIAFCYGAAAASCDMFQIDIEGKGGHGAMPQNSIDPINVGAHIHLALQELIAREIAPGDTAVLTIGCFKSGETCNIIPRTAMLRGSIRTYDPKVRTFLNKRLKEVAEGTAATFRAEAKVTIMSATPVMEVDHQVQKIMTDGIREMLGAENVRDDFTPLSGSEDFACVGSRVPAAFCVLGADPGDREEVFGQHHPKVFFDENAFPNGSAAYVKAAVAWLEANR